mmetsp:Transcript_19919/g.58795  ORF Transcript_19919/g.58795 Transcript_19919/m.58795 type:complete len:289 (-) Transcript_19919:442-1308(-)
MASSSGASLADRTTQRTRASSLGSRLARRSAMARDPDMPPSISPGLIDAEDGDGWRAMLGDVSAPATGSSTRPRLSSARTRNRRSVCSRMAAAALATKELSSLAPSPRISTLPSWAPSFLSRDERRRRCTFESSTATTWQSAGSCHGGGAAGARGGLGRKGGVSPTLIEAPTPFGADTLGEAVQLAVGSAVAGAQLAGTNPSCMSGGEEAEAVQLPGAGAFLPSLPLAALALLAASALGPALVSDGNEADAGHMGGRPVRVPLPLPLRLALLLFGARSADIRRTPVVR